MKKMQLAPLCSGNVSKCFPVDNIKNLFKWICQHIATYAFRVNLNSVIAYI